MTWTLVKNLPRLLYYSFIPHTNGPYPHFSIQRLLIMLLFWPLFLLILCINQLGMLLDHLLFPTFSQITVKKPLFVLGIPRSGTTFLHRLLATDQQRFTTTQLWELLFAPSITQRYFWLIIVRIDHYCGAPLYRLLTWSQSKLFTQLNDIHQTQFTQPEEDYFALTPILGCFLLILPFGDPALWKLCSFDRDAPEKDKRRLIAFYYSIIQRHLYFHGKDKTYLAKNPSFTPFLHTLLRGFPDACIVACVRTPNEAVPSQISAIMVGTKLFSGSVNQSWWQQGLLHMLSFYYQHITAALSRIPSTHYQMVRMERFVLEPATTVQSLYQRFGLTLTPDHYHQLQHEQRKAKQFRSKHQYSNAQLGIDRQTMKQHFGFAFRQLGYEHSM